MTCILCGDKSKKRNKDFTRAVVEIDNPEEIVLLRKVTIPASMGTEEQVPAAIGRYRNVVLHYEANKHTYICSSDGIPTLLESPIPQSVLDEIDNLKKEIELSRGATKLLTKDDRNWNTGTQSATEPYDCVALWLLPPGMYQKDSNTGIVRYSVSNNMNEEDVFVVGKPSTNGTPMLNLKATKSTDGQGQYFYTSLNSVFVDTFGNSTSDGVWKIMKPANNLFTESKNVPLAAKQGKILDERTPLTKTSAPTNADVGTLGQLLTDTSSMHTYQCTAIDMTNPNNPVYTWTQRW